MKPAPDYRFHPNSRVKTKHMFPSLRSRFPRLLTQIILPSYTSMISINTPPLRVCFEAVI